MIFAGCLIPAHIVSIVLFKWRVRRGVGGAAGRVHIRRIEHNTVQFAALVWQFTAIHALLNVGCPQFIGSRRDVPPEHSFPIGNIGDNTSGVDVKLKNLRKYVVVAVQGRA